jgi:hypothetical protein
MKGRELAIEMINDDKTKILRSSQPFSLPEIDEDLEIAEVPMRKRTRSDSINSIVSDVSVKHFKPKHNKIRNCISFSFPKRTSQE